MGLAERRRASSLIGAKYYTVARHRDTRLREAILERLPEGGVFLDAGCGGRLLLARQVRERCRLAIGVDLEPPPPGEPGLRSLVSDLAALGLRSGLVDVAAMRSVSEHLPDPGAALREIGRVLKPGGSAVILSPNKWYYASVAGRLVPERAASSILRLIYGRSVYDNFPTYYRANTRRAVARLAAKAGLGVERIEICEHPPDYLKLSPFLFRLGVLYDRITARWRPLHGLAVSYLFVLRKPGGGATAGPRPGAAR